MKGGRFRRWVWNPVEAGVAWLLYGALRAMPLDLASGLGGVLARALGPRLGVNKIGDANLKIAFPNMSANERRRLLRAAWDNLGRTLFEYAHLDQIVKERVTILGLEHLAVFRDDDRCGIVFSGHFANWEILPATLKKVGVRLCTVYRAPNNPSVDALLRHVRGLSEAELAPKGSAGARRLLHNLKRGQHVGMLVDQKMNDGVSIPFFDRPAMTASAIANLALKFDAPLLALQPVRLRGASFRLIVHPLIEPRAQAEFGKVPPQTEILTQINRILETWVRDHPGQWLWFHRRWPKS